ncbi:ABC transporter permease [Halobaculum sp. EA56]|uniref:ABC transporter permease n=1 Tax=Halobaculum sp. EA56 TaxID=3421648 RepID=UPI003EB961FF
MPSEESPSTEPERLGSTERERTNAAHDGRPIRPDGLPTPGSIVEDDASDPTDGPGASALVRIRADPGPAVLWGILAVLLLVPEIGAVASLIVNTLPSEAFALIPGETVESVRRAVERIPTLLSRELLPNQGYRIPGKGWHSTAFGLSPAAAWALRVTLVLGYVVVWLVWTVAGYRLYRRRYRRADWTPMDDAVDRFSRHRWGQFGLIVVVLFVTFAVFAPTVSPTTAEQNIRQSYSHELVYYSESAESVKTTTVGSANLRTASQGTQSRNVGPLTYDRFGRFHPFGTLPSGRDLFTFMAAGARVSLFIGLLSITLSAVIAGGLALSSAYYRGRLDLAVVLLGDSVQAMPQLLVIILVSVALANTWLAGLYNGGVLIALVFAGTGWPGLWRAVRGPALRVSTEAWVEAAKGLGQRPTATMRKHMLPYIVGYLLVYGSMILGGVIIGIAGLSFLGLGVSPPTPEWGRAINVGQPYLNTRSWHISLIPGLLIVLVVTGFNALGDGVRDAIDPQSDVSGAEAATAGGGGA